MRNLILALILLLALFTLIRAYTEEPAAAGPPAAAGDKAPAGASLAVYPGVVELGYGPDRAGIAFGLLQEADGGSRRIWNVLPIRISLQSGDQVLRLGLNGLDFLTRSGVHIGRDLRVRGVRRGDLLSVGGDVTVEGTIEGSVWTFGADIRLLAGAVVGGDAVALGGTVEADSKARVQGTRQALPDFRIPFLGLLTSAHAADILRLLIESFGVILFLILLFLLIQFARPLLSGLTAMLAAGWKESILLVVLAAIFVPVLVLFLVLTILGILIVPFLFVLLIGLAYLGYLGVATRLGLWIRREESGSPFFLYTSGLLGLLVLKGPVLIGILLSLFAAGNWAAFGRSLASLGTAVMLAAGLFGLGGSLTWLRRAASR